MNDIVENGLYAEIDRLRAENKKLTIKTSNSLANNLCPDHRDKQAGKPCLACEIDRLRAQIKELTQSRDEWKRIATEAKARVEGILADMREIGVAE